MMKIALTFLWCGLLLVAFFGALGKQAVIAVAATPAADAEPATIEFGSAAYSVDEGAGNLPVVLLIEPPSSEPITVTVSSSNLQAEADSDFEGLRQSLVISPGTTAYTLSVVLLDDLVVEGDEQLRLTLGEYRGVLPGVITETVVTIVDNDVALLGVGDVVVSEAEASVTLVVTQSNLSIFESIVDLRTEDGTATALADYVPLFTTVVIPAGETQATVEIELLDDDEVENTETFTVLLEDATNAQIGKGVATVTLVDDELFPELIVEGAEANEADGLLPFVVTLTTAWPLTVTVDYATSDGSAVAGEDYVRNVGMLVIPPGNVTATLPITLITDTIREGDETFFLLFTNPVQATLTSNEVVGTIRDGFSQLLFLPGLER
jgi:hypothetical protein